MGLPLFRYFARRSKNPTISNLSDEGWVAVHTILGRKSRCEIIFRGSRKAADRASSSHRETQDRCCDRLWRIVSLAQAQHSLHARRWSLARPSRIVARYWKTSRKRRRSGVEYAREIRRAARARTWPFLQSQTESCGDRVRQESEIKRRDKQRRIFVNMQRLQVA